jgi:uncharacterized protein (DUF924 family)
MNARSSISSATEPERVLACWRQAGPKRWFAADPAFDAALRESFAALHAEAARGTLSSWEQDAAGALALILLTDQIPRNIFRHSAHAFATDEMARNIADRAMARGFDQTTAADLRLFFYLPFEHHEDAASQARAVALCERLAAETGMKDWPDYARLHQGLIARFGRFPHRNAVLGRVSTPEEIAYLAQGGFAG